MSRYCPHDISAVLDAAAAWKERCLLSNGSILSTTALWSLEHLAEIQREVIDKPDEGSRNYLDKLKDQLESTSAAAKALAAEALWFLMLFPVQRAMKAASKRELSVIKNIAANF